MSEENQAPTPTVDRAPRPDFLSSTKFEDFDLPHEVLAGLEEAGFINCTPIQAQALPVSLTGRDVAGQAQTGTGKTAAFLVAVFDRLLKRESKKAGLPGALIIAPTRELALQVREDALVLGKYTGLTTAVAVGGIDYREQAEEIKRGPDIVICTPGRLIDYLKQGIFKTTGIEVVVVDEADRLFDLGFIKDLRYLLRKLPHFDRRQTMLFSATLSHRVLELTYEFMNLPEFISVIPEDVTVDGVDQLLYHVGQEEKFPLLLGLLEKEDWTRLLIFANTKATVEWLASKLQGNGYPAEGITGDLPQPKRIKLMDRFKDNRLNILVATDVASRGIHVEDISHVINYDLPQDAENYVHRIGRTARAGKKGRALSFACEEYVFHLEPLENLLGYKIPTEWHDEEWLKEDAAPNIRIKRHWKDRPSDGRERSRRASSRSESRDRRSSSRPPEKRFKQATRPGGIFGLRPGYKDEVAKAAELEAEARARGEHKEAVIPEWEKELHSEFQDSEDIRTETDIAAETDVAPEDKPKKKRRRPRRKKKSAAAVTDPAAAAEMEDQATPAETSMGAETESPAEQVDGAAPEPAMAGEDAPALAEEPKKKKRRPRRRKKPAAALPRESAETTADGGAIDVEPVLNQNSPVEPEPVAVTSVATEQATEEQAPVMAAPSTPEESLSPEPVEEASFSETAESEPPDVREEFVATQAKPEAPPHIESDDKQVTEQPTIEARSDGFDKAPTDDNALEDEKKTVQESVVEAQEAPAAALSDAPEEPTPADEIVQEEKPRKTRTTRARKTAVKKTEEPGAEVAVEATIQEAAQEEKPKKTRTTRAKKTAAKKAEEPKADAPDGEAAVKEEKPKKARTTRAKKTAAKKTEEPKADDAATAQETVEEEKPRKTRTSRAKKTAAKKTEEPKAGSSTGDNAEEAAKEEKPRKTGTTRAKKTAAKKTEEPEAAAEETAAQAAVKQEKPKKTRTTRAKKTAAKKTEEPKADAPDSEAAAQETVEEEKPKKTRTSRAKKTAAKKTEEPKADAPDSEAAAQETVEEEKPKKTRTSRVKKTTAKKTDEPKAGASTGDTAEEAVKEEKPRKTGTTRAKKTAAKKTDEPKADASTGDTAEEAAKEEKPRKARATRAKKTAAKKTDEPKAGASTGDTAEEAAKEEKPQKAKSSRTKKNSTKASDQADSGIEPGSDSDQSNDQ